MGRVYTGRVQRGAKTSTQRAGERVTIEERVAAEVVGEPSAQFRRLFEYHVRLPRLHVRVVEGIRLRVEISIYDLREL